MNSTRLELGLPAALTALLLAAVLAIAPGSAIAASSRSASRSCHPNGTVLANKDGVVVFSEAVQTSQPVSQHLLHPVFLCTAPTGRTDRLSSDSSNARVTAVKSAASFVGFFVRTNVEVNSKFLVVVDRADGRIEVKDLAECDGNDECTGPNLTGYVLARDGWVAELWSDLSIPGTGLLATHGGRHYQLELGGISRLSVSAGRARWTSALGGASSIALGPSTIPASAPGQLSACQLLSSADLAPLLGTTTGSTSGSTCTYGASNGSGDTLTVQLTVPSSASQGQAQEAALTDAGYSTLGNWWPASDAFYDLAGSTAADGLAGDHFGLFTHGGEFAHGAEVLLDLHTSATSGQAQVAHLAIVAGQRLYDVPVRRAQ